MAVGTSVRSRKLPAGGRPLPRGPLVRLNAWFGTPQRRRLAQWSLLVPRINARERQLQALDDDALRKESRSLQYRAKSGEPLSRLLPEAFALVRDAARRTLGMRHFEVQLLGGIAMHHRSVVEMQTGEGKTLTATLPLYLHALGGKGAHLATANDYLARRDAEWMQPLYALLGMRAGVIEAKLPQPARREAYACDITYGTAKEFGFDFLRDRLLLRRTRETGGGLLGGMLSDAAAASSEAPVGRGQHFCLVDESDSLLIDEGSTPLIISALPTEAQRAAVACFKWAARVQGIFSEDEHYRYDHDKRSVELTTAGRKLARSIEKPAELDPLGMVDIYQYVERAIKVGRDFELDRHYVVRDGEVVIVDEFTGRLAEGRKWREGIHQAVEAKQGVEVSVAAGQAAQITVQELMNRYEHLAGMTGTAATSARELRKMYKLRVVTIPTNRPCIRERLPDRVFARGQAKWAAIVQEIQEMHAAGRPVLIGTRTIDKSEHLSRLLQTAGIEHQVLNAKHLAAEAEIVADAGQRSKVTVATNMAGRGTDIKLGEGVAALGGLHVICTELHDAARIDRQLAGRCARQGDPGSVRQYMAADDDILRTAYGPKQAGRWAEAVSAARGELPSLLSRFRAAQRRVERKAYRGRKLLMYRAKQRKKMLTQMGQDPYLDTPG